MFYFSCYFASWHISQFCKQTKQQNKKNEKKTKPKQNQEQITLQKDKEPIYDQQQIIITFKMTILPYVSHYKPYQKRKTGIYFTNFTNTAIISLHGPNCYLKEKDKTSAFTPYLKH